MGPPRIVAKIRYVTNQWAADITYVPMNQGGMYLVAVMDWYSRKVLSFRVSNTPLDAGFCVEALCEALERYGPPDGDVFLRHSIEVLICYTGVDRGNFQGPPRPTAVALK